MTNEHRFGRWSPSASGSVAKTKTKPPDLVEAEIATRRRRALQIVRRFGSLREKVGSADLEFLAACFRRFFSGEAKR
jgi:hypothetical protein